MSRSGTRIATHLSVSLLAVVASILLCQFGMYSLRGLLADAGFRLRGTSKADSRIVLVSYDDPSSNRYQGMTRLPPEEISSLLIQLKSEKPLAVLLLAPINERNYSQEDLTLLGTAFSSIPNLVVGYTDDESLGKRASIALGSVPYYPGFVSRDTYSYGADSVTRRVMLTIDGVPTAYLKLSCLLKGIQSAAQCFESIKNQERVGASSQSYINWQGPPPTYQSHSFVDVLNGKLPVGTFSDKIILIGSTLSMSKTSDYILTPYSRLTAHTSTLEGAAHSLVTLLQDIGLKKPSPWLDKALSILVGLITVNFVLLLSPMKGILLVLSEVLLLFAAGTVGLTFFSLNLNMAHPIVLVGLSYYLVVPFRLLEEYRKRWHFQEQSEFMGQLEQLKNNFLSLVTHDLKTPIATIQGNAELLLNSPSPITESQRKGLSSIVQTSESLSQYVETILDLTRIERSQVPLQKTSRDINSTIKEVVSERSYLATDKKIDLSLQLEPLFSIKFDAALVRRILANLIDNAIKYSPTESKVVVRSFEEPNWVKITVQDSGPGIERSDRDKIFEKFYRCDNEISKTTKGSGLGLYLVKYFVELHDGIVELDTEVGRGSTFTVSLPI